MITAGSESAQSKEETMKKNILLAMVLVTMSALLGGCLVGLDDGRNGRGGYDRDGGHHRDGRDGGYDRDGDHDNNQRH
jgi:hypothetical protein